MKKWLMTFALSAILLCAGKAIAQDTFVTNEVYLPTEEVVYRTNSCYYVKALLGPNWERHLPHYSSEKSRFDTGFFGALGAGYRWDYHLSFEAEVGFRYNDINQLILNPGQLLNLGFANGSFKGHMRTWAFMANCIYEVPLECKIQPYAGFGLGWATSRAIFSNKLSQETKSSDSGFAYQLMAGAKYPLYERVNLMAEYRFFGGHDNLQDHSIAVGLDYNF